MNTGPTTGGASEKGATNDTQDRGGSASTNSTIVPQFALDAADEKISTLSAAIVDAADTIERLVDSESLPLPDGVRELATSTTEKLRSLGTTAGKQDAAKLVAGLQRTAAAHPAASIGIGAAIGAALAALLVRLGSSANPGASNAGGGGTAAGHGSTAKATGRSETGGKDGPTNASTAKNG